MSRSEWEMRQLDIESGKELDRHEERKRARAAERAGEHKIESIGLPTAIAEAKLLRDRVVDLLAHLEGTPYPELRASLRLARIDFEMFISMANDLMVTV